MSIAEIKEMDYEEYIGWFDYLSRRPPGWKEDLRAYYIMSSGMGQMKQKPEEIFPSIRAVKKDEEQEREEGSKLTGSLKASPFGLTLFNAGIT
jgi:hypothetical protein